MRGVYAASMIERPLCTVGKRKRERRGRGFVRDIASIPGGYLADNLCHGISAVRRTSRRTVGCVTSSGLARETRTGGEGGRGRRCNCQSNVSPEILHFRSRERRMSKSSIHRRMHAKERERKMGRASEREGGRDREREMRGQRKCPVSGRKADVLNANDGALGGPG